MILGYSRYLTFAFISLIVLAVSVNATTGHCPNSVNLVIQQCVQPVAEYAKVLNQKDNSTTSSSKPQSEFGQALSLPKLGGQVFTELCRLIGDFNTCVEPHREKCPKHITINLIEASYGYLCNAGYETFMNSAECLMELDQRPSVKHCHDETLRDIEKANGEQGITMPAKLDRMCEALNFFSGCVRHPIRHNCGLEAWQVIFRVLKDTTKTLMPACQFTGTSPKITHRHHKTTSAAPPAPPPKPLETSPRSMPDSPNWHVPLETPPPFVEPVDNLSSDKEKNARRVKFPADDETIQFSTLESKQAPPSSSNNAVPGIVAISCTVISSIFSVFMLTVFIS
uniref:DUF19 domain-containing protein n=1 Tax=Panagrellus redivivus TaxID=6233 RepID=A0A7E4W0T6_PANRE